MISISETGDRKIDCGLRNLRYFENLFEVGETFLIESAMDVKKSLTLY